MTIDEMLPQVKQVELEILSVFDEFCRKNDLKYSLAYGTLLGAVRHKGFIPWDDDIDVWMPRDDYEKFIELWQVSCVDGYLIQNIHIEPDFTQNYTKIRKDNTTFLQPFEENYKYHKGIFIDIFPLDRISDNKIGVNIQRIFAVLSMLFARKYSPNNEKGIKKIISKVLLGVVPKKQYNGFQKIFEKGLINIGKKSNRELVCFDTFQDSYIYFPSDMMNEFVELEFEGKMFYAISQWDDVLKNQYGDYMQFPPEEDRVWKHHPLLIDIEHNY